MPKGKRGGKKLLDAPKRQIIMLAAASRRESILGSGAPLREAKKEVLTLTAASWEKILLFRERGEELYYAKKVGSSRCCSFAKGGN